MSKLRIRRSAVVAASLAVTLTMAACGNDKGGDAGSSSGGDTIKLGLVTSVGTRVDFKDVVATAKAAALAINEKGGIKGKKLEIVFCNESLDPNKGRACVRDLISQGITAMVGASVSTMEADMVKMLAKANIPNFGPGTYGAAAKDPNTYMLQGGWDLNQAATIYSAVASGNPKVVWAPFDLPLNQGYGPVYETGTKIAGGELVSTVKIAPTTTDMAPIAAQIAKADGQSVIINMSGALIINLVKALSQLGWNGKWISGDAAFNDSDLDHLPADWLNDRALFVSPFPPLNYDDKFPGLKQFKSDLAAASKAGISDIPSTDRFVRSWALNSYFSVIAAGKVLQAAGGTDAKAFKASADTIKDIDLGGVVPPWTPSKSASKVDTRVSNPVFWFYHWKDGKQVLDTPEGVDVSQVWDGSMS
jgi:branched-chain amino acid transport system substrate-binding protein